MSLFTSFGEPCSMFFLLQIDFSIALGNGKPIQIYDGRRSLADSKQERSVAATEKVKTDEDSGRGEIIYFRDSDDEMPDSDEDPDDDLDI